MRSEPPTTPTLTTCTGGVLILAIKHALEHAMPHPDSTHLQEATYLTQGLEKLQHVS